MDENKEKKIKYKNPFVDESAFEGDEGPKPSEDEVLMDEAKQHAEVQVVETYMALGMVMGVAIGAAFGSLLFGKMTTGMGIGMLIGLIAGTCIHKKPRKESDNNSN